MKLSKKSVVAVACLLLFSKQAQAFSPCDLLGGDVGALCRAAEQSAKEKKRQKEQAKDSETPAETRSDGKRKGRSTAIAPPENSEMYRPDKFYGVNVWADAYAKAVNDPAGFKEFLAGIVKTANGVDATVNALAMGPKRNFYQKFLTDYQAYSLVFRSPTTTLEKIKQCTVARDFTPAEACDCVAGFPGDTLIGPGAGELVTESNSKIGINACGKAAAATTDPRHKARYIAQRARAQVYTFDTYQAVQWADEAKALGYPRVAVVKASAALHDFEFRNSGFPPPNQQQNKELVDIGIGFLKASKVAGVKETYIVAQQFRQALAIYRFNTAFYAPIFKSMTTPPPASADDGNCQLSPTGTNGAGGIVYGMRCK